MIRAAVYARISSDPLDTGLGVQRQLKDCAELASRLGWTVVEEFIDNDTSATSGEPRPRYEAMMAALRQGRLAALVVWDVDRLTRTPRDLEDVVDLAEQHHVLLASVGGEVDLATPQGRLTARIKGSVARHESEQLSRRVRAKMAQRVAAGKSHGRVAYGWRREYEHDASGRIVGSRDLIDPAAAQVVRQGAQRVLAGESLRSITRHLTEIGAPTATGTPWDSTALRGILLRQRNVGLRTHQGHVVGRGDWEPILDEATFERVTAILTDPARRNSPASSAVKYLLSGIARCGLCGGPMRVLLPGQGHKQDSYVCQDKYHVRRMRQPLDDFITEVVVARLSRPDAVDLLAQPDNDDAHKAREQAGALRARLDLAADAFAAGDIDARQLARITARLRPELDQYEQIARSLSTAPDLVDLATPDIAERWTDLPLDRRRAVIDTLMMIRVLPTRRGGLPRFDPASLRIEWKASYRSEP